MSARWGRWLGVFAVGSLVLARPSHADDPQLLLHTPGSDSGSSSPSSQGSLVLSESSALPRRVSIGFNNLGGQLRFHFRRDWAVEQRFLMGEASSNVGTVHANVFGLRGYRFFEERHRWRFYAGIEGDYVHTSLRSVDTTNNPNSIATISGFGETSGYAVGGFGGVELRLFRRLGLDFDVGPYIIGLKEKVTQASDSTLDFVANTAINVYLF
jgi:hypothetical protein